MVFDGNETDPDGKTLQAQDTNLTSSDEEPYKFMTIKNGSSGRETIHSTQNDETTKVKRRASKILAGINS